MRILNRPLFTKTWVTFTQESFVPSLDEIYRVVLEKKIFKFRQCTCLFIIQYVYGFSNEHHAEMSVVMSQFSCWTTFTKFIIWIRDTFPGEINIFIFLGLKSTNRCFDHWSNWFQSLVNSLSTLQQCATHIDAVFCPFLVETSIKRKILDSFLKSHINFYIYHSVYVLVQVCLADHYSLKEINYNIY